MTRGVIAALAAVLLLPSAASAASFGELPYTSAPHGVSCLRPTGVEGELLAWAPAGVQLYQATAGGLKLTATVALGHLQYCPVVAARPNGAAVVAGVVGTALAIAQRDAGGAWSPPQTIPVGDVASNGLAVGVSPAGYAVVAYAEHGAGSSAVVRAVRRAPGGTFGAPELVSGTKKLSDVLLGVATGIGDDGVAMVMWQRPDLAGGLSDAFPLEQSMAATGTPFSAPVQLATGVLSAPKLAVAPDGRALAVFGSNRLQVSERPPGGTFGPPAMLARDANAPVVAIQPDGSAMAAWLDNGDGLVVARRTGTGPLGPAIQVRPGGDFSDGLSLLGPGLNDSFEDDAAAPADIDGLALRMATDADGAAVFTWGLYARVFGVSSARVRVAVLPGGGFTAQEQTLGAPVRPADTLAPVLAGGSPALAWGDAASQGLDGRLHYALQGAPAPAQGRPPAVRIGNPERTAVGVRQSFVIPVTCSAACDVRATTARSDFPSTITLRHAGRATLVFPAAIAPLKRARVKIAIVASAPGASAALDRSIAPRLRRIPDPPLPAARDVVATRHGTTIVVSWRIAKPAPDVEWFVGGISRSEPQQSAETDVKPSDALTFHATLRHAGSAIRTVQVIATRGDDPTRQVSARVR